MGSRLPCFKRRKQVGGLWAYTKDPSMTTALPSTRALISKYTCGMSDFPMPDHYPPHLTQAQFQEYMESYAKHFDLLKDIVSRNDNDTKWRVEVTVNGVPRVEEFDKLALCHGYQTYPEMPKFECKEKFEDILMHAQQFRPEDVEKYKGKNVVMVGMSSTATDVINNIISHAANMYLSHRRGMYIFPTWRDKTPADLLLSWRRRRTGFLLQRYLPGPGASYLRPASCSVPPGASDTIIPLLQAGRLTSLHGIKRFLGPRSIEFTDGSVLDDIDAVVCATGYTADLTVAPFLSSSRPPNYSGPELLPMAVSNIFRHAHPLPSLTQMESAVDAHHAWLAARYAADTTPGSFDRSMVKSWEFQGFLHEAAGTGMENLGEPRLSWVMNHGVETAHAFRVFETGKRRAWEGAREAILRVNRDVASVDFYALRRLSLTRATNTHSPPTSPTQTQIISAQPS
ncbi:FAD/NAD(P)-binding domain-containing protein [Bimuria novae-zelandiae CBS 107.79]|uniref:FAD/NAD(P)-binding domain-containing protein n=1 Tax=Bimuria novae-zelandiae CBS 107.79 TaxID=1447943 RepID=A0A6A5V976_9PLEO|nr:FAD/NAD(P)-binding domain-containing protein [Bimuria novae-zelandiae CBS 107.79]